MRLKPKELIKPPKTVKVMLTGELTSLLEQYCRYYQSAHKQEIAVPELLMDMAEAFLKSDREFIRWRRNNLVDENI